MKQNFKTCTFFLKCVIFSAIDCINSSLFHRKIAKFVLFSWVVSKTWIFFIIDFINLRLFCFTMAKLALFFHDLFPKCTIFFAIDSINSLSFLCKFVIVLQQNITSWPDFKKCVMSIDCVMYKIAQFFCHKSTKH